MKSLKEWGLSLLLSITCLSVCPTSGSQCYMMFFSISSLGKCFDHRKFSNIFINLTDLPKNELSLKMASTYREAFDKLKNNSAVFLLKLKFRMVHCKLNKFLIAGNYEFF